MWYGEKYSSWQEFNDQALTPLADKPSPTNTWEIDKLVVSPEMAWAYTTTTRHLSDQTDAVVWMTFILERYRVQPENPHPLEPIGRSPISKP